MKAENEIKLYKFLGKYQLHASISAIVLSVISLLLSLFAK